MQILELNQETGMTMRVITEKERQLNLSVSIPDRSLVAGLACFVIDDNGSLVCQILSVDKECRREGIASAMFEHAERHFQKSAVSGLRLTPDCVEFYKARGMIIPADAKVKSFHDWFDAV